MGHFAKIISGLNPLTIFPKDSILDCFRIPENIEISGNTGTKWVKEKWKVSYSFTHIISKTGIQKLCEFLR